MKILIVDQDVMFARLIKRKLEQWGHRVHVENDGTIGYDKHVQSPYRMVFLDNDLPGMSGLDLCAAIRRLPRSRYTYITFYSSESDKASILSALEAGADGYLTKPFNPIELKARIKNGKRLLNVEDHLREGAGLDHGTGCLNAASLRKFFFTVLADIKMNNGMGSLIAVSVNNFNSLLSDYGFTPTQAMMKYISNVLEDTIEDNCLVSRWSDDAFLILLPNMKNDLANSLLTLLDGKLSEARFEFEKMSIKPEIEWGIKHVTNKDNNSDAILESLFSASDDKPIVLS